MTGRSDGDAMWVSAPGIPPIHPPCAVWLLPLSEKDAQYVRPCSPPARPTSPISASSPLTPNLQFPPIQALPPELLILIFQLTAPRPASLIPIALVCQHWRSIALHTPSLWANLDARTTPAGASTALTRSGNTPLRIHIDARDRAFLRWLPAVRPALPRLATLELTMHSSAVAEVLAHVAAALPGPAPGLRALALRFTHGRDADAGPGHGVLFGGARLGALETLVLRRVRPWEAAFGVRLVSLRLTEVASTLAYPLLLACLRAAPNLESLALLDALPRCGLADEAIEDPVGLPRLRSLYLHDLHERAPVEIDAFLARLQLPSAGTLNACIVLTCEAPAAPPHAVPRWLAAAHPLALFPQPTALLLAALPGAGSDPPTTLRVRAFREHACAFSLPVPCADVAARLLERGELAPTLLLRVGLAHVTYLALGETRLGGAALGALFRALPALETLVLYRADIRDAVGALGRLDEGVRAPAACPRLRHVFLLHFRCAPDVERGLACFAWRRAKMGHPLASVRWAERADGRTWAPDVVGYLQRCVGRVEGAARAEIRPVFKIPQRFADVLFASYGRKVRGVACWVWVVDGC